MYISLTCVLLYFIQNVAKMTILAYVGSIRLPFLESAPNFSWNMFVRPSLPKIMIIAICINGLYLNATNYCDNMKFSYYYGI